MPQAAKVRSSEAIEAFRNSLRLYRERAGRVLDDVRDEVRRTRSWLEGDRKLHWRKIIRERENLLAQAEAELLTARLSGNPGAIQDRRLIVNRARKHLAEAQDTLQRVHHWLRHFETDVESHAKPVLQLRNNLQDDLEKALASLESTLATLHAYAEIAPPQPPSTNNPTNPNPTSP